MAMEREVSNSMYGKASFSHAYRLTQYKLSLKGRSHNCSWPSIIIMYRLFHNHMGLYGLLLLEHKGRDCSALHWAEVWTAPDRDT